MSGGDTLSSPVVHPQVDSLFGQSGVHIRDPIEDVQTAIYTDTSVSPSPTSTDGFVYPVDTAVSIQASEIRTPFLIGVYIRNANGELLREFTDDAGELELPQDSYLLEITGLGLKIYLRVSSTPLTVVNEGQSVVIRFGGEREIQLGLRSLHSQPAGRVTTTTAPEDIMEVVSVFGNAMKTWSPERTYPSLRGHPPLVTVGDSVSIPEGIGRPDTGIEVTVPAEHRWVYPVVPLAYWLGAGVRPGEPAVHIDGQTVSLGSPGGDGTASQLEVFERRVRDLLQYTFLFDCAVRTEGFYDVELAARDRVAAAVELDFEAMYDASLSERVQTYLEVAGGIDGFASTLERPSWELTADIEPVGERASVLPFLARDLAVVRCQEPAELESVGGQDSLWSGSGTSSGGFGQEARGGGYRTRGESGVLGRSGAEAGAVESESAGSLFELPEANSMTQTWVGDGFAVGAAKASTNSYLQRLENYVAGESSVSVDVIVNDEQMADEKVVSEIYGTRESIEFETTVSETLTADELASVFESDSDFVHYIGHVDEGGFECTDGHLDGSSLGTVGTDTFFLNACASYQQGQHLVDRGAIGGVVTLQEVISSVATSLGKKLAHFLNYGFPLGGAMELVHDIEIFGGDYAVVGDTNTRLVQSSVPVPNVKRVALTDDSRFEVTVQAFGSWNYGIGSMYQPYIPGNETHYVIPRSMGPWTITEAELDEVLGLGTFPVAAAGTVFWSDSATAREIRNHLEEHYR